MITILKEKSPSFNLTTALTGANLPKIPKKKKKKKKNHNQELRSIQYLDYNENV